MDRLLIVPWDRLTREGQRIALVAAQRSGEEKGAVLDGDAIEDWRDRGAEWLADNPDASPEYLVYLASVVEPAEARRTITPEELAYWHDRRGKRDPRVIAFAHAWWERVVDSLPLLCAVAQ